MSFFERAKAAANDLAAKADVAMSSAGISVPGMGADRALRDLGVLAWLGATGRPVDPADRERVMGTLRQLESEGRLGSLTVTPPPGYGAPPPPGGSGAASAPPPPTEGTSAPVSPARDTPAPPPPGTAADERPDLPPPADEPPTAPPPPPPPSWA
ncbi:hypothetical protein H9L10_14625 [Phycicoccus endophyticus]|uniref:Uncharacterized protein n=1 Tax=Phycicoccus endophyticus TaxID=1690220 RepID=A0A7G9R1C7_9MICO|nr:hypothetical protein [Phycicoccus endophyticus]NHI18816.1 hypothetical protein [Phycicoccus endophyticus]QNN49402.1 hypothetical protein H9L10_14625 [Phycicoccus endophyticus]GGL36333.1 hypothetical protein GCM10012283_18430 [Phycicoccus endophyticus]